MNVIKYLFLVCLLVLVSTLKSQENLDDIATNQIKRLAMAAERISDWESASIYYEEYIERNPKDIARTYRLAENNRKIGKIKKAANNYKKVYDSAKDKFPLAAFYYARTLVSIGSCKEAIPLFNEFRKDYKGEKDDRKYIRLAKFSIEGCEKSGKESANNDKLIITAFPNAINGLHIEGSPIYLGEGKLAYNSIKSNGKTVFEIGKDSLPRRKFYLISRKNDSWEEDGVWEMTKNFTAKEIANGAFNLDRNIFYFSACSKNTLGLMECDLYRKKLIGKKWSEPEALSSEINSRYTETQPTVGRDDRGRETVYFVSDRKEGKGGLDIWYTSYNAKKDNYKAPKNAGSKINSVGDEISPFVSQSNGKLYFSSNGHPNYGGFDVFKATGQRSKFTEPENIGISINSAADELYYVLNENGEEGIFVSNRLSNTKKKFCCDDLYEFKELDKIKVELTGTVQCINESIKVSHEITNVQLYLIDKETNEEFLVQNKRTDKNGNYSIRLEPNKHYRVKTIKQGFLVKEEELSTEGIKSNKKILMNFSLESYKNRSIIIENIYYKFDRAELTQEAMNVIDTTIYEILIENSQIIIELSSHTDSKGTEAYNESLSQQRAESVVKYLRKKGIPKNRLTAKGYGEKLPIAANKNENGSDNPKGRAKNRRTEFKVIGELEVELED